jgi:hypothetical protein
MLRLHPAPGQGGLGADVALEPVGLPVHGGIGAVAAQAGARIASR